MTIHSTIEEIHRQRIIVGDSLELMTLFEAESFDAVITSPPYNIGARYDHHDDTAAREDYLAWLDRAFMQMHRVLKPDGALFLNLGATLKDPMIPYQVLEVATRHFTLQNNIIWVKSLWIEQAGHSYGHFKPINSPRYLNHNFEHLFMLTKTGSTRIDRLAIGVPFEHSSNIARFGHAQNLRCRGNVWHIPYETVRSRKTQRGNHPATFPVGLPQMCLSLLGNEPDPEKLPPHVLDPFAGSGSTLVAAARLGWRGTGIELSPDYADFARQRLADA